VRGWESQRSSAPLYPRGSITGSQGEQDGGRPTEEDFGEAMHWRHNKLTQQLNLTVAFSGVDSSCQDQVTPSHSTFASLGSETL
jgi:hypothetical protein